MHPRHGNFVENQVRVVAREHSVAVATVQEDPKLPYGKQRVEIDIQETYTVAQVYYGRPPGTGSVANLLSRARAYRTAVSEARTYLRKPDVIHAHVIVDAGIVASIIGLLWRCPYVVSEHSTFYTEDRPLAPVRHLLAKWACSRAGYLLPVSNYLKERMQLHGLRGNYRSLSNVVDTDRFLPGESWRGDRPFRLLHVSNFRQDQKNLQGLLRAYAHAVALRPGAIYLTVAGDGEVDEVQRCIYHLDIQDTCRVTGPHSEGEIAAAMEGAHAFVLFSNFESQGVVLIEALSAGLPCVTTAVGGPAEIITDSVNGWVVPVGDEVALTQALLKLIDHYGLFDRQRIRQDAIARYGEAAIMSILDDTYRTAADVTR